mmetsp:Transcript_6467/g.7023  ORF Transcript_6467/g.7023 Transcript_6467/m.7023 type:complete len:324 (-) Transcript_6467:110-1081(-)
MGQQNAKADTLRYRQGYPGLEDDPDQSDNQHFYQNKLPSRPTGDLIDVIHVKWWGDYELLERHHGYIQWLFPIREHGMNMQSQVLQPHEITVIREDPLCQKRIVKSYSLMLDFYGLKLVDEKTGEIARADHWKPRFGHLNHSFHNYLRITRILKSLGETGFEHFKKPFLDLMITEVIENGVLINCKRSLVDFWSPTLRIDAEREAIAARLNDLLGIDDSDDEDDDDDDTDSYYTTGRDTRAPVRKPRPAEPLMPDFHRSVGGKGHLAVKPDDYFITEDKEEVKSDAIDEQGPSLSDTFAEKYGNNLASSDDNSDDEGEPTAEK